MKENSSLNNFALHLKGGKALSLLNKGIRLLEMQLFRAIMTLSGFTILSRISGFIRDIILASTLGTGPVADAFFIAFRLPNFFRRLFAEGAMNAAFIPTFSSLLDQQGKVQAQACAEQVFAVLLAILLALVVGMEVLLPSLMSIIAPGYSSSSPLFNLTIELSRIVFPYILFISLAALLTGILNAFNRFALGAASQILVNVFMIAALLGFSKMSETPAHALSWSILAAGGAQLLWVYTAVWRLGIPLKLRIPKLTEHVRYILKIMMPAAGGAGVIQINMLIGTAFLSYLPTGSVSFISYADRLHQLPLSVIGVAISTALLPILSRQLATKEFEQARVTQNRALEFSLLLTLPATVGLFILAQPLISLLFEGKNFPPASVQATAHALQAFAVGLPAYVLVKIFSTSFFARHDSKTPVQAAIIAVGANILLNCLLIGPLAHVGIALATSLASWINVGWLLMKLRHTEFLMLDSLLRQRVARILLASGLLALLLVGCLSVFSDLLDAGRLIRLPLLLSIIGASGLSYLTLAYYFNALDIQAFRRPSASLPSAETLENLG